jgi:hypothetical protein
VLGHEVTFEAEDKIMELNMFIELEDSFQNQLSDVVTALPHSSAQESNTDPEKESSLM